MRGCTPCRIDDDTHIRSPITSTSPASEYVGIDQSITYGSAGTTILSSTAGITDTGTTLVLLASGQSDHLLASIQLTNLWYYLMADALTVYQRATGAVTDPTTGLLKITADQYANLESLFFHIGGTTYEFTPNAQIWPRAVRLHLLPCCPLPRVSRLTRPRLPCS